MDDYQDTDNLAHEQPESGPSQGTRQPNERNSKYCRKSGCGSSSEEENGDGDGGGGGGREEEEDMERGGIEGRAVGESDEETLVNSEVEDNIRGIRVVHSSSPASLARAHVRPLPIANPQSVGIRLWVREQEPWSSRSPPLYSSRSTPRSTEPEPCESGERSTISSPGGIPRPMSPGRDLTIEGIELVYYFLVEPLRLSPHYRDCRGRSHLVVRDEVSLIE